MSVTFTADEKETLQLFDPMVIMAFLTSLNELRVNTGDLTMEQVQETHDMYFVTRRKLDPKTLEKIYNELKTNPRPLSTDQLNPTIGYSDELVKSAGVEANVDPDPENMRMPLPEMDDLGVNPDKPESNEDGPAVVDSKGTTIEEPEAIKYEQPEQPVADNVEQHENPEAPSPMEEGEMPL
jgi:hypothetical protein